MLAARDDDYAPPILLAALLAASLQPDAATGLAVMLAAVGLYNATRETHEKRETEKKKKKETKR